MSEFQSGKFPGCLIGGGGGSSPPSVHQQLTVAQSELTALREENERLKSESFEELYNAAIDERDALREELAEEKERSSQYGRAFNETSRKLNELQPRLTAAQQRNAELVELLHKARRSIDPSCAGKALRMELDAALKPTESGASE